MKRYDLTTEYNKYACEDQVVWTEAEDGLTVKWKDHLADKKALQERIEKLELHLLEVRNEYDALEWWAECKDENVDDIFDTYRKALDRLGGSNEAI